MKNFEINVAEHEMTTKPTTKSSTTSTTISTTSEKSGEVSNSESADENFKKPEKTVNNAGNAENIKLHETLQEDEKSTNPPPVPENSDMKINPLLWQLHQQNNKKGGIVETGQLLDRHRYMMREDTDDAIPKRYSENVTDFQKLNYLQVRFFSPDLSLLSKK